MATLLRNLSDDSRDLASKLRRLELEAILVDNGMSYPTDPPAELSRTMVRGAGIDVGRYFDETGNFLWPSAWLNRHREKSVNPGGMKRPDLIKFCKEAGIDWSIKDKKADLQRKVEAHLNNG